MKEELTGVAPCGSGHLKIHDCLSYAAAVAAEAHLLPQEWPLVPDPPSFSPPRFPVPLAFNSSSLLRAAYAQTPGATQLLLHPALAALLLQMVVLAIQRFLGRPTTLNLLVSTDTERVPRASVTTVATRR